MIQSIAGTGICIVSGEGAASCGSILIHMGHPHSMEIRAIEYGYVMPLLSFKSKSQYPAINHNKANAE